MASWRIDVGGTECNVSVSPGENDKHFIRVNGRIAAPAMGAGDIERELTIAGAPFVVRRNGAEFELYPLEQPPPAGDARPASSGTAAKTIRTIVLLAIAGAALYGAYTFLSARNYENAARERVMTLLATMKGGEVADDVEMRAMTLWFGRHLLPYEVSPVSDRYLQWAAKRNLYHKPFTVYSLGDTHFVYGQQVPTAIVAFNIEGTDYKARVAKGQPIEWEGSAP